jgi:comEA protein
VRERKPDEDAVAQRLRAVLAGSIPDRPAAADGADGLAEVGGPLQWSDIISGWPDDVDLEAAPSAGFHPSEASGSADEPPAGGYRVGTPWAAPPPSRHPPGPAEAAVTALPGAPVPVASPSPVAAAAPPVAAALRSATGAYSVVGGGLETSHLADLVPGAESPHGQPRRPLPAPSWAAPSEPSSDWPPAGSYTFDPAAERFAFTSSSAPEPEPPALTGAGAFGGSRESGRLRFGPAAFDPGRRGVRALVAVAAVVIVIAAVVAWRSRPRVDPVAPPPLTATGSPPRSPVSASAAAEVVVAVGGKVRKPGLVRLASGARVADALTAAGGADPGVDVAVLNLARKVVDGELIMVGVTPPPGQVLPTGPAAVASPAGGPVNLNSATLADLDGLPGVGPVLAQRILDARDAQGGFKAVSDLRKVDGIGDARYEQLKDLVTV